jgi:HD superfamily phosphohydrolase YqeK
VHPIIEAAGREGVLPDWANVSARRQGHIARVTDLLDQWADSLGIGPDDRIRWKAAGQLHDALKDAPLEEQARWAGAGWPDPVMHGPACAERLRAEGVEDEELLLAVAFHSIGHPALTDLGEHLYLADYLEPGRKHDHSQMERLRARMPAERETVLGEVAVARVRRVLDNRLPLLQPTIGFWNRVVGSDVDRFPQGR